MFFLYVYIYIYLYIYLCAFRETSIECSGTILDSTKGDRDFKHYSLSRCWTSVSELEARHGFGCLSVVGGCSPVESVVKDFTAF